MIELICFDGALLVQKNLRLKRREDFSKVYKYGKSAANHQFVIYYLPNRTIEQFQLGISVSKKVGNAVVRNRVRRKIKEIIRLHVEEIKEHNDLVIIVRKPAVQMDYHSLEKSLIHVFKKATLIKRN